MMSKKKIDWTLKTLCVCIVVCLISMIGASLVQSDFGKVDVTNFSLASRNGKTISVLLYRPKAATASNKVPLIITCHGSYNNKEMQDINCIELSRRGFAVISMDAYGHGSSTSSATSVERYDGMIELVEYAWTCLNYIDLEKIGITGHSMGAKICNTTAEYYLAQEQQGLGPNKISAIFNVGTNPSYDAPKVGEFGPIKMAVNFGLIAAKYDEWNYRSPDVDNNVLRFLESDNARKFVNQVGAGVTGSITSGEFYSGEIDGNTYQRVIYQPNEIHPKNHFSKNCAAYISNFFYTVFGVPAGASKIAETSQIWHIKEGFNGLGLAAIFFALCPLGCLLMKSSLFSSLRSQKAPPPLPALSTTKSKVVFCLTYLLNCALPAILFVPIGWKLVGKSSHVPTTFNQVFGQPNTNELAAWSLIVALLLLGIFLLSYQLFGKKNGVTPDHWGVKISCKDFFKTLLASFLVIWLVYSMVFFADFFFKTDFRIWMVAIKTFNREKVILALTYVIAFVAFYLVNSLLVNGGNRISGLPEWALLLISCISNVIGIGALIFIQYSIFTSTGTLTFNAMRIVNLFPLLLLIPVGTLVSRSFFKKTGNIYMGSLVIGMLYAMMTCANTWTMGSFLQ